jgi:hypothetical protein
MNNAVKTAVASFNTDLFSISKLTHKEMIYFKVEKTCNPSSLEIHNQSRVQNSSSTNRASMLIFLALMQMPMRLFHRAIARNRTL